MSQMLIPILSQNPLALDVETGGTNPAKHALLSIGAYTGDREFYVEIRPVTWLDIEQEALNVNGLNPETLREKGVEEPEAMQRLVEFLKQTGDVTVLGQNPSFDLGFLRAAFQRAQMRSPFGYRAIDLHSVALTAMTVFDGGYPIKQVRGNPNMLRTDTDLDGILNYVGLEKRPGCHNALEDARLTYQALERLVQKFRGN
jgi:DNA polymerase III epsilon subunit-like protein